MADISLIYKSEIPSFSDMSDDCFESVKIDYNDELRDSYRSEICQEPVTPSNWNQQFLNTQLLTAVVNKDVQEVQSCLNFKANPNSICRTYKFSALHLAVTFDAKDILRKLLEFGADPRVPDLNGLTPLHYGAWFNRNECMALLINSLRGADRTTFINRTVEKRVYSTVDEQNDSLNHKCDQLVDRLPKDVKRGLTALHIACQKINIKCVVILLEHKLDINLKDNRDLKAFDIIGELLALRFKEARERITQDFVETINIMKNEGAQKGSRGSSSLYFTPIHAAVMLSSKPAIAKLAHSDLDPNRFDEYNQTPIHLSIIKRKHVSLEALLECVENVAMKRNGNGLTPFQAAVKEQWIEGIGILMRANVDITEKAADGRTVLHIAAATGNADLLEELLKLNKIKKILNTKNNLGETPIYTAITCGTLECVELLLKNNVDLDIRLHGNITAIHRAAELGKANILDKLLEHEKENNLYLMDEIDIIHFSRMTPLHMAANGNHAACVRVLLKRNCNYQKKAETQDYHGWLGIHLAANKDNAEVVKEFLDHDKGLLNVKDNFSKTPLYFAALHGHRNTIEVLLKAGANLSTTHDDPIILYLIFKTISNPTEFLYSIFNNFVTIDTKYSKITDRSCTIKMDFGLLLATERRYNQMSILHNILHNCKGSEQRELIIHPLIECFLFLKWRKLRWFFGLFLLHYAIFVFFLTGFILCVFHHNTHEYYLCIQHAFSFQIGLFISLSVVCLMDILLIATNYNTIDKERIIKWISLFCAIILMVFAITHHYILWQRHIASLALISSWVELMLMISKFPECGYYVQMFCKVVLKVIKVMLLFSCLIFGFALAFTIELQNVEAFWNPLSALMKTIAIMMAELDYNDLFTDDRKANVHIIKLTIYFVFITLATIALMNLMVGLAVNDIQELVTKGVVDRLAAQIDFLYSFESNIPAKKLPNCFKLISYRWKTVDKELLLFLSNPENRLTKELSSYVKERILKVVENNNNRNLDVSNKDILEKLNILMQMIKESKNNSITEISGKESIVKKKFPDRKW